MDTNYTPKDLDRFWSKVDKSPHPQGCWLWTAYCIRGHGQIMWCNGSHAIEYSHRVSYLLTYGAFDYSLEVCHECDNPSCVNPEHLFLGTQKDNMQDMREKGRGIRGESVGTSKLTWDIVRSMRMEYSSGNITLVELGSIYGIHKRTVGDIIRGVTWKESA